jgi:hypothetical protein
MALQKRGNPSDQKKKAPGSYLTSPTAAQSLGNSDSAMHRSQQFFFCGLNNWHSSELQSCTLSMAWLV